MSRTQGPIPHGTASGYARKCRCQDCRRAHTDAAAWYALRKRAEAEGFDPFNPPAPPPSVMVPKDPTNPPDHGTRTAYKYGCRCDPCREAATVDRREYKRLRDLIAAGWETPVDQIRGTIEHFMRHVEETHSCWYWIGERNDSGYGKYRLRSGGSDLLAHRAGYELFVGPIPQGLELDHVCHNDDPTCWDWEWCPHKACVNPEHLEPVTPEENKRRMGARVTHCPYGHQYTEANTVRDKNGWRSCRECKNRNDREYQKRRKAGVL